MSNRWPAYTACFILRLTDGLHIQLRVSYVKRTACI